MSSVCKSRLSVSEITAGSRNVLRVDGFKLLLFVIANSEIASLHLASDLGCVDITVHRSMV